MSRLPAGLWQKYIAVQIYGANTDVGKTVFSTLLGLRAKGGVGGSRYRVHYIKPVSTGPSSDRDDRLVCCTIFNNALIRLTSISYIQKYVGQTVTTLFQFNDPVSPHIAARDSEVIVRVGL